MEEEFDVWVVSFDATLATATFDFSGSKVAVPDLGDIAQAFEAERAAPVRLPSSELFAALQTGVIDLAADTSPDFLGSLVEADPSLSFYRVSATTDGITSLSTVPDTAVFGTNDADVLTTSSNTEEIFALAGNDTVSAGGGNDTIDGGDGDDTATFTGSQDDYTLVLAPDGQVITDRTSGRDGSDTLIDVETLDFAGSASSFSIRDFGGMAGLSTSEMTSFVELYIAYFNRAPDAIGLGFWGTAFANGTSLQEMAAFFIDQEETRQTYPETLGNEDFARAVYDNVLGRSADQAGFDFWVGVLNAQTVTRDQFILEILAGAKAEPPQDASQEFITQQLADQAYLSDKTDLGLYYAVILGMSDVENAAEAMALYEGSQSSFNAALDAIDGFYAAALSADTGTFLLQLDGVVANPIAPFQAVDDRVDVDTDASANFSVLDNDIGSGLRVEAFTENFLGTLDLLDAATGTFRYTPPPDFAGLDTFSYSVTNDSGRSDIADVTILLGSDAIM